MADPQLLEAQGREQYKVGRFADAIALWQTASASFEATNRFLEQAMTLSNLSLAHQQLGQWPVAESTIQAALAILAEPTGVPSTQRLRVLAQALDVWGRFHLIRGEPEAALTAWEQAAQLHSDQNTVLLLAQNQMNQAKALQALGLYTQARNTLLEVRSSLDSQSNSAVKVQVLIDLGNVLRLVGDFQTAQTVLQEALALAAQTESQVTSVAASEIQLSLGNLSRVQGDTEAALRQYRAAADTADLATQITARLHQLDLLVGISQIPEAQQLWPQIQAQLGDLPPGRARIYAQIELGRSLTRLSQQDARAAQQSAQLLSSAVELARQLSDQRAESYAVGSLGALYEQSQQLSDAIDLTRQALVLSEAVNAAEISYRWQWQLGRLLKAQGDREGAIAAYQTAVDTLQRLRRDLVAISSEVQFSFRDEVEPVYRELVDLLLQVGEVQDSPSVQAVLAEQEDLRQARSTLELLQLAELDNFFREACLVPHRDLDLVVDQSDPTTAVLYAVVLADRLEVILKLPGQPLRHYASTVTQGLVEQTVADLARLLLEPDTVVEAQMLSQQVFDWLIRPTATALKQSHIKTLVFVLDDLLRGVPMAALYNGEHYLIEQYAIALTPGLQLVDPKPLNPSTLSTVAAGLTEARDRFPGLPYVKTELEQIQSEVASRVLLNEQFTAAALQNLVSQKATPIVHLATHGQFGESAETTFLLAWDRRIRVNELDALLRRRDQTQSDALELLVLSACETAQGDRRAALGMAGVAVRAGARSTVASLWQVSDQSTAALMSRFYQALATPGIARAEALRQAQLAVLNTPGARPLNWAPFVLLGSWL